MWRLFWLFTIVVMVVDCRGYGCLLLFQGVASFSSPCCFYTWRLWLSLLCSAGMIERELENADGSGGF